MVNGHSGQNVHLLLKQVVRVVTTELQSVKFLISRYFWYFHSQVSTMGELFHVISFLVLCPHQFPILCLDTIKRLQRKKL
jgi:hypothetical protein